jgi:biotin synthase-like enzyme
MEHTTNFERAIFFSWYCKLRDCKFCYMSTQKAAQEGKFARRTTASILAEVLITKKLGWEMGFLSGGIGAYQNSEFGKLLSQIHSVFGEKIWISVGALTKDELLEYLPHIKGVVGSIETVNKKLHKYLCPSKPIEPYLKMFEEASKLGLKNAITIILGMGETAEDFPNLKSLIEEYHISKIHFYALNPQKGTIFEGKSSPTEEYQADWIRKTREAFPKIDIQCGIWEDKVDRVGTLLKAGASSISKYPALKYFGAKESVELEDSVKKSGFRLKSSLTHLPKIDWDKEIDSLELESALKEKLRQKLWKYLRMMTRSSHHKPDSVPIKK